MQKTSSTKKILVTGSTGFTGQYLTSNLRSAGHEVHEFVSAETKVQGNVDLLDRSGLAKAVEDSQVDSVIHLAAISFVGHENIQEIYDTNIVGTRNLLEALANSRHPVESVILASTSNVYGRTEGQLLDESQTVAPANDYAISKLAMEHLAGIWRSQLPITITRPFNYTGVGQSVNFLVPKIISHYKNMAKQINLGNLEVERDFLDVRDVAKIYADLANNPAPGEVFNIASGRAVSIAEIIAMMNEIAGYEIEVVSKKELQRSSEIKILTGDSRKLWAHLGYEINRPLRETLTWMFES